MGSGVPQWPAANESEEKLNFQSHFFLRECWDDFGGGPPKLLPRHWTSVPLQSPLDKHSRTLEPTSVYPVLQEKMAVAPYTVSVPILLPFGGVPRSPQEMTESVANEITAEQHINAAENSTAHSQSRPQKAF